MARIRTLKQFDWSLERRVLNRCSVDPETGCWLWNGSTMRNGYGQIAVGGVRWAVHRYVYTETVGPIPEGLDLDHLCRNRACCNPAHLEPVTRSENLRRGEVGRGMTKRTHCPRGHPYDEVNTYRGASGKRQCRACSRDRARRTRGQD